MSSDLVVIVESGPDVFQAVRSAVADEGCKVRSVCDEKELTNLWARNAPGLFIIGDVRDGAAAALRTARSVRARAPRVPILLYLTQSSEEIAMEALRCRVQDLFIRPNLEQLMMAVCEWAGRAAWCEPAANACPIVGESVKMRRARDYADRLAEADCNVLITGETGTGKELIASWIHSHSARRDKPFVAINCAAMPDTLIENELFGSERGAFTGAYTTRDGKFRHADGGTILLDEIGEMSPVAQAKVLRAIENREVQRLGSRTSFHVDVRMIAATNQDLDRMVTEHRFRADLYFRLSVAELCLPPLRDRPEDIPLLLEHFTRQLNATAREPVTGFSADAMAILVSYPWPGNIRELRNVVEAAFVTSRDGKVEVSDLPQKMVRGFDGISGGERTRLLSVLEQTHWNKSKAAEQLQWSRMTLYRKMAKHEIAPSGRLGRSAGA